MKYRNFKGYLKIYFDIVSLLLLLFFFLHIQYVLIKTSHLTNYFHFGHNTLMMFLMYCNTVKESFGKSSVKKKIFYFTSSVLILLWLNRLFFSTVSYFLCLLYFPNLFTSLRPLTSDCFLCFWMLFFK